jgi:hypothetical protein
MWSLITLTLTAVAGAAIDHQCALADMMLHKKSPPTACPVSPLFIAC